MPSAACELPGEARSAARARRFLREFLRASDLAGYDQAAELVLTELVANAALHAKSDLVVAAAVVRGRLRLSVSDLSERPPTPRSYRADATTGRGLTLIEALSAAWGVEARPGGKTVWAEVAAGPVEGNRDHLPSGPATARRPPEAPAGAAEQASGGRPPDAIRLVAVTAAWRRPSTPAGPAASACPAA